MLIESTAVEKKNIIYKMQSFTEMKHI
jgi:hypothetical protein